MQASIRALNLGAPFQTAALPVVLQRKKANQPEAIYPFGSDAGVAEPMAATARAIAGWSRSKNGASLLRALNFLRGKLYICHSWTAPAGSVPATCLHGLWFACCCFSSFTTIVSQALYCICSLCFLLPPHFTNTSPFNSRPRASR